MWTRDSDDEKRKASPAQEIKASEKGVGMEARAGPTVYPRPLKSGELRIAAVPSITVRPHRHICGLNARVDARVDESAVDEAAELSWWNVTTDERRDRRIDAHHPNSQPRNARASNRSPAWYTGVDLRTTA